MRPGRGLSACGSFRVWTVSLWLTAKQLRIPTPNCEIASIFPTRLASRLRYQLRPTLAKKKHKKNHSPHPPGFSASLPTATDPREIRRQHIFIHPNSIVAPLQTKAGIVRAEPYPNLTFQRYALLCQ